MENTRKQLGFMLAVILVFSFLNSPALAADGKPDVIAAPVQYTLFVNGNGTALWAYEIDGDIYFKLRDLAMIVNGTKKQFDISWDESKNIVSLVTGTAYTPVGGELSGPSHTAEAIAHLPAATFNIDKKQIPIRSYIVNNAHYIMLSDLAAGLLFPAACDKEKRNAEINTQIDGISLQFRTEKLSYKELPVLDESRVTSYIGEDDLEGIKQGFYKADGNTGVDIGDYFTYGDGDNGDYSYIVIGSVKYDLGWVTYGDVDKDYLFRGYGIKSTDIKWDTPIYQLNRLFGLAAPTTSYLTIENGVPYIIFDTSDWGIQYDIDGDGAIETTANVGGSTSQDYILYEWDMKNKSIQHVRLKDIFNFDATKYNITRYDPNNNLFYAESRDNKTGEWEQSAYEYKDGMLIKRDGLQPITIENFSGIEVGTPQAEIHKKFGKPSGMLSGLRGDMYTVDDKTTIIVYYDKDGLVDLIKVAGADGSREVLVE